MRGTDRVTFHVFRKSAATDTRAAAVQLGHSSVAIAARCYVAKGRRAPDLREHLQVFDTNRH